MANTNYYAVNGRIRGESTGGVFRRCGTDALGSVVTTFDGTGAKENTYRYTPYGAQLATTGLAADPTFLWLGSLGYRHTSRTGVIAYVRARHYLATSQWASLDQRWPVEWAYAYANSNPTAHQDASGTRPCDSSVGILPPWAGCGAGESGYTACYYKVGAPYTCLCTKACDARCTDAHEGQHRSDERECCHNTGTCMNKHPNAKSKCVDAYTQWFEDNSQTRECRAYRAGKLCRERYIGAHDCWHSSDPCCKDYLKGWRRDVDQISINCPAPPFTECPIGSNGDFVKAATAENSSSSAFTSRPLARVD